PPFVSKFDTHGLADGAHVLTARVSDPSQNASTASVTLNVDNTPPSVSITSPAQGASLQYTIPIKVAATDAGSGMASVTCAYSGLSSGVIGSSTSSPYAISWDTACLEN